MPAQAPGLLTVQPAMEFSDPTREQHKRDLAVEVLRTSGRVRLAARGYSMLPSLWPGDVLTVQTATSGQVVLADVVLCSRDGKFSIHRVLRLQDVAGQLYLITRGDSMFQEDSPVAPTELLGKVIAVEREGRLLSRVPACTPFTRAIGLALGSWGRLRSIVLRWRQRRAVSGFGAAPDGVVTL
jgi:hypothetical protein